MQVLQRPMVRAENASCSNSFYELIDLDAAVGLICNIDSVSLIDEKTQGGPEVASLDPGPAQVIRELPSDSKMRILLLTPSAT